MKAFAIITFLLILCSFTFSTSNKQSYDIEVTKMPISCINTMFVKNAVVISTDADYREFLSKTSASELIGDACLDYTPPVIDFDTYHLILVHSSTGGCEPPEVLRSFIYNDSTDQYEFSLTFKQKGICKVNRNYFESFIVKKMHIDISKFTFSSKTIMPTRQ